MTGASRCVKRSLDVTASALAMVVLAPLFLLVAIAVRLETGGPVLFRQTRVGKDFRLFQIIKFRTMITGPGPQITVGRDTRITRVGWVLRRSKMDELPQLINVLRGDMSLVGPRPEVGVYVEMFRDDYADLLRVGPGLTDPASLFYSDEAELLATYPDPNEAYARVVLPEKIRLSREYLARSSLRTDVLVIAATIRRAILGRLGGVQSA